MFGISAPRMHRLISAEPDEDSTNPPPDAPAALQPRSRAGLNLAQVSPVFVRVCATGRRPGSLKTCSSPRSSNSPASLCSRLPQGTNPILFQSQTTQPTRTTLSPSPSPPSLRHPTCPSSRLRPKPVTHPDPVQPALPPVKASSALDQPKPSRRPAPARQAPNLCNSDRQGTLP